VQHKTEWFCSSKVASIHFGAVQAANPKRHRRHKKNNIFASVANERAFLTFYVATPWNLYLGRFHVTNEINSASLISKTPFTFQDDRKKEKCCVSSFQAQLRTTVCLSPTDALQRERIFATLVRRSTPAKCKIGCGWTSTRKTMTECKEWNHIIFLRYDTRHFALVLLARPRPSDDLLSFLIQIELRFLLRK